MESMSHDPVAGVIGLQLVDMASRGVSSGAAASMSMTALVPAGADEVSAQAAAAFATEGAAMLALHTAAQEELARTGVTLTDIARMYAQVDGAAAGTLDSAGSQFQPQQFVTGTTSNAGLMRVETLPGSGGSAARTPLLASLIDGAPAPNPGPTVPGGPATVPPAVPAAVNAASAALGAGAAPLSSIGSIAQGASAGGSAEPGLASSLAENQDEGQTDDRDDHPPGEHLV
jgi:PE family protein